MYAPVVHRFRTYGVDVAGAAADYMGAMQAHPAFAEWTADAFEGDVGDREVRQRLTSQLQFD